MVPEAIDALRILNDHPDTAFTVITGEGRFFSAGADVRGMSSSSSLSVTAFLLSLKADTCHRERSEHRARFQYNSREEVVFLYQVRRW